MSLVLIGKGLLFGGLKPQNRGQTGSRYIYIICIFRHFWGIYLFYLKKKTHPAASKFWKPPYSTKIGARTSCWFFCLRRSPV